MRIRDVEHVQRVKLVVFVPLTHSDAVRQAMGVAGAGKIGNYSYCSFSMRGVGRYRPDAGANPAIGSVGNFESVDEERIETVCETVKLGSIIAAIKAVHPYEEVVIDVYPLV